MRTVIAGSVPLVNGVRSARRIAWAMGIACAILQQIAESSAAPARLGTAAEQRPGLFRLRGSPVATVFSSLLALLIVTSARSEPLLACQRETEEMAHRVANAEFAYRKTHGRYISLPRNPTEGRNTFEVNAAWSELGFQGPEKPAAAISVSEAEGNKGEYKLIATPFCSEGYEAYVVVLTERGPLLGTWEVLQ